MFNHQNFIKQRNTYIFQDSSKEVLIEALSNQKKFSIDFQNKISKILLKMPKINCPICQEVSAFPFATKDKGKAFRYFKKNISQLENLKKFRSNIKLINLFFWYFFQISCLHPFKRRYWILGAEITILKTSGCKIRFGGSKFQL